MSTSVSSVVSHFPSAENGFTTSLASTISSGATTVPLNSVAGYSNGEIAVFVIDPTDANKKQTFTGVIDTAGVQVTSVIWTAGINQTHSGGATVVDYATATHISMITKGIMVDHSQTGGHEFTTVYDPSNPTLETLKVAGVSSAVNEVTVTNAATGNAPSISATGGDTNIDADIIPKGTGNVTKAGNPIDWWEEIGRTTLGSAGDTITISDLPERKYLKIIAYLINTGGTINGVMTFNSDTGNNYAGRRSTNGAADATSTSAAGFNIGVTTAADPIRIQAELINIATQPKESFILQSRANTTSAASVPEKSELVWKWANTSDQITRVDVVNSGTGDYAIGSEVVVLGHD